MGRSQRTTSTRGKPSAEAAAASTFLKPIGAHSHQTPSSPSAQFAFDQEHQEHQTPVSKAKTMLDKEEEKRHQLAQSISEARRKSLETIKIPPKIYRPVVLCFLSYSIQEGLILTATPYLEKDLSVVAHYPEGLWRYAVLIWKFVETLAVYYGGFDVPEAVLLTVLSRAPTLLFLSTFHPSISLFTLLTTAIITSSSVAFPLYFLRNSLSPQHQSKSHHHHHHHHHHHQHHRVLNSPVDSQTYISTALLSSSIYATTLYTSLKTFLTKYVFLHSFYPETHVIESVEKVYQTDPITWAAHILPVGIAIADVIFARAMVEPGARPKRVEGTNFGIRIWNGLSPRMKMIIKRTAFVASYMLVDSIIKLGGVVKGGTLEGSAVIGAIWAAATIMNGAVLGWIGME